MVPRMNHTEAPASGADVPDIFGVTLQPVVESLSSLLLYPCVEDPNVAGLYQARSTSPDAWGVVMTLNPSALFHPAKSPEIPAPRPQSSQQRRQILQPPGHQVPHLPFPLPHPMHGQQPRAE